MSENTLQLTPEVIDAYKTLITDPKKHDMDFDAITECFEKSETVTAKHELADAYINHINKPLPKLILYIIMDDIFGQCNGRDKKGNAGYFLKFNKIIL